VDQPGTSDDADEAAGDDERQSRCGSVLVIVVMTSST
jgi:hypothetical protein